jgi:hypothetical protein
VDQELREVATRYTIVGVVIAAAAIWTVWFVKDNGHENGAPVVIGSDAGPAQSPDEKAPSLASMFTTKNGAERVLCAPACKLEAYCSLRSVDECLKQSCDGDVRALNKSDFTFARADDCAAAAAASCAEGCFKRGECAGEHGGDARCTEACVTAVKLRPGAAYRASRCTIEAKSCVDVAGCAPSF